MNNTIVTNDPIRVQRKLEKGWEMPKNTVYVGHSTKWGNPFKLVGDMVYVNAGHRRKVLGKWVYLCQGDMDTVLRLYKSVVTGFLQVGEYDIELDSLSDILHWVKVFKNNDIAELKGKNLASFCSLNQPSHADILLEIANHKLK